MFIKANLNFHNTFKPEKQYISSLLELANNTDSLSVQDISSQTGIPAGKVSGKVEPHIFYSNYMGLIDYKKIDGNYSLKRTILGEKVFAEDPGFQEELTTLLCHCMMLREKNGAPLWAYAFKNIFPNYRSGVKKNIFLLELNKVFNDKVNTKNIAPFFGSYESFFKSLNILNISDNINISSKPYNKEFIYLYALILFEYWNEAYLNQEEITSVQLDDLCFGKAFGWDKPQEYSVLEHLSDKGIIRLNRQLMPYTVLKLTNENELVNCLYSELC